MTVAIAGIPRQTTASNRKPSSRRVRPVGDGSGAINRYAAAISPFPADPSPRKVRRFLQHVKNSARTINPIAPRLPHLCDNARYLQPVNGPLCSRERNFQPASHAAHRPKGILGE